MKYIIPIKYYSIEYILNIASSYFFHKLITGEFEVIYKDECYSSIKIENYTFYLWTKNNANNLFCTTKYDKASENDNPIKLNFSLIDRNHKKIILDNINNKWNAKMDLANEEKQLEYLKFIDN